MKRLPGAILAVCLAFGAGLVAATEVQDERLTLNPAGVCGATPRVVSFNGKPAQVMATTITATSGGPLYASAEPILDVATFGAQNAVLSETGVTIVHGKNSRRYATGVRASGGRILYARPDALLYYLTAGGRTTFFTQSAQRQRVYFAAGQDFVTARGDEHANTVIAFRDRIVVVTRENRVLPLLEMEQGGVIENIEIARPDNAILLQSRRGLLKISPGGRTHSLIAGSGSLQGLENGFAWCDRGRQQQSILVGLDTIGTPASDKAYAAVLLDRTKKLLEMGVEDRAFINLAKISELVPDNTEARRLAAALARRLTTPK